MKMRTIFISYKREDSKFALQLRQALRGEKFNVWWDEDLQTGEEWEERIDQALMMAEAILVVWSKRSVDSEWVKHEASIGKIRGVLTHVLSEDCQVPKPFKSVQAISLTGWSGQENDPNFVKLVSSIRAIYRRRILKLLSKVVIYCVIIAGTFLAGQGNKNWFGNNSNLTMESEFLEVQKGKSGYFKLPSGKTESVSVGAIFDMHSYLYTGFRGQKVQLYVGQSLDSNEDGADCKVVLVEVKKTSGVFRIVCE